MLPGLGPALAPAQPLAVQEMGPGQVGGARAEGQVAERVGIERLGVPIAGQQRAGAGQQAEGHRRPVRRCPARHPGECFPGGRGVAAADRGLDESAPAKALTSRLSSNPPGAAAIASWYWPWLSSSTQRA